MVLQKNSFMCRFLDPASKKDISAHAEKRLSIMNEEEDEVNGSDERRLSSQNISQV